MNTPDFDPNSIHILFVVERPPRGVEQKPWNDFQFQLFDNDTVWPRTSSQKHKNQGEMLAENVWLLPLENRDALSRSVSGDG